jgi:hypothetical protein
MRCRHTVADWHRFVDPAMESPPIFAACRLLVRERVQVSDSRTIACNYWGHQVNCPVYEGPEGRAGGSPGNQPGPIPPTAFADAPLADCEPWPVRLPGESDTMRRIMMGLGLLSVGLLVWTGMVGLWVVRGTATPTRLLAVTLVAAVVSTATHVLAMLRAWAGR